MSFLNKLIGNAGEASPEQLNEKYDKFIELVDS